MTCVHFLWSVVTTTPTDTEDCVTEFRQSDVLADLQLYCKTRTWWSIVGKDWSGLIIQNHYTIYRLGLVDCSNTKIPLCTPFSYAFRYQGIVPSNAFRVPIFAWSVSALLQSVTFYYHYCNPHSTNKSRCTHFHSTSATLGKFPQHTDSPCLPRSAGTSPCPLRHYLPSIFDIPASSGQATRPAVLCVPHLNDRGGHPDFPRNGPS